MQMKKHSVALGSAIVAHFNYFTQKRYLAKTNLLERYNNLSIDYFSNLTNNNYKKE